LIIFPIPGAATVIKEALSILLLSAGVFLFSGFEICFSEEGGDAAEIKESKTEEFEKRLDKLTEQVEKIINSNTNEKEEIKELRESIHQLTEELKYLKGKQDDSIQVETGTETENIVAEEEASDEHLYFEGLGKNENLPGRTISLNKLRVRLWIQYRLMYNASNIPGPAGTTFGNTKSYDFLSQRARLGIDIRPFENVGGYVQLEFSNRFGVGPDTNGSGEEINFNNVAFNRLNARGLRYAYFYASPFRETTFLAGILPSSDYLGDTQFSADWDFNVGGVAFTGILKNFSYRLSYLRLISGMGFNNINELGENADLVLFDLTRPFSETSAVGLHVYYLFNDIGEPSVGEFQQAWIGATGKTNLGLAALNSFIVLNFGKFDQDTNLPSGLVIPEGSNLGFAVKGEAVTPLIDLDYGPMVLSGLFIFASGDKEGRTHSRFNPIEGLVGTEGYWAYTHIFTANGPSDVNDFGLDIGNTRLGSGAGLLTAQVKMDIPLYEIIFLQLDSGVFWSAKDRAGSKYMGTEVGGMFTIPIVHPLNFQIGLAYARLGGFFESLIAEDQQLEKNIYEVFSRIQLEF
jgi:hypothetical protein